MISLPQGGTMLQRSDCILDASAVIAYIHDEPGSDIAEKYILSNNIISAVNFSEVIMFGYKENGPEFSNSIHEIYYMFGRIFELDEKQALVAAELFLLTRQYGLSFADRACLALGKIMNIPVITADKVWLKLDIGVKVICIR